MYIIVENKVSHSPCHSISATYCLQNKLWRSRKLIMGWNLKRGYDKISKCLCTFFVNHIFLYPSNFPQHWEANQALLLPVSQPIHPSVVCQSDSQSVHPSSASPSVYLSFSSLSDRQSVRSPFINQSSASQSVRSLTRRLSFHIKSSVGRSVKQFIFQSFVNQSVHF